MKLKGEVLTVSTNGDSLSLTMQACEVAGADWRPLEKIEIRVRDIEANRRTFRVGRRFVLTLTPEST